MAEPAKTTNGNGNGGKASPPAKQETQLQIVKRSVVDVVKNKIDDFIAKRELYLPKNYSPDNAMKAAWLVLQEVTDKNGRPALEVCTRNSIANALLDMVVQGLNPVKKQNYFIVYGKTLVCQRSYFGSMAVAQMVNPNIAEFAYACVYEGDKFKYGIKNGKKVVSEHEQDIENVDKAKIMAAYCIALDKDGEPYKTEIMTFEEIKQAWRQSKVNPFDTNGNVKADSTHGKFTSDMAMKTVVNKCCKAIINASSDNTLLLELINKSEDLSDRVAAEAEIEDAENAGEVLEVEAEDVQETETDPEPEPEQHPEMAEQVTEPAKQAQDKRLPGF